MKSSTNFLWQTRDPDVNSAFDFPGFGRAHCSMNRVLPSYTSTRSWNMARRCSWCMSSSLSKKRRNGKSHCRI